jgi:hypothetical protein
VALSQFDILGVYFSCFNYEGVNVICIKDSVRRMSDDISLDVDVIIYLLPCEFHIPSHKFFSETRLRSKNSKICRNRSSTFVEDQHLTSTELACQEFLEILVDF